MKKLILILLLLSCGLLYAENITYETEDHIQFSIYEPDTNYCFTFKNYIINAIIPHGVGYLMKYTNIKDNYCLELFIDKGFVFYIQSYSYRREDIIYYECKIIDIKPNQFVVEKKEIGRCKNIESPFGK